MPAHFVQGAGIGTGSAAVATVPHVEQSQLRLRMRSSGPMISSGGPRRSITSRSVFMAQDVGEITGDRHQPSRLFRCGEPRHDGRHELASHPQGRRLETIASCDAGEARKARLAALRWVPTQHHDRAARTRSATSARHADAAAHDLKGDALHTLRSTAGMLLAGAAQYALGPRCRLALRRGLPQRFNHRSQVTEKRFAPGFG